MLLERRPPSPILFCTRFEVQLLRLREPRLPDFVADLEVPRVEACETLVMTLHSAGTQLFAQYQSLAD